MTIICFSKLDYPQKMGGNGLYSYQGNNGHQYKSKEFSNMFPLKDVKVSAPHQNKTFLGEEPIFSLYYPTFISGRALKSLRSFHCKPGSKLAD